ncbi:hypothetical protein ACFSKM_15795 [Ancylobacter dichloromethanicus]
MNPAEDDLAPLPPRPQRSPALGARARGPATARHGRGLSAPAPPPRRAGGAGDTPCRLQDRLHLDGRPAQLRPRRTGLCRHLRHDPRRHAAGGARRPLLAPMVECEIAFVMGAGLDGDADLSDDALGAAVATAHVACEVVDARYGVPPPEIGAPTLLTDDFLHVGFVLGPPAPDWRTLPLGARAGAIEIDGAVHAGSTAEVLAPFEALRWLVRKLAANGERMEAGAVVLTGTLVAPTPIRLPARHVAIEVEGFGRLDLRD